MLVGNDGDLSRGERRRRSWTRDEKRRIVEESLLEGASIAEVARRHELNANLLFTWRRQQGAAKMADSRESPQLVPVTITTEPVSNVPAIALGSVGRMEIVLGAGERIIVGADVDTIALARVIKALSGPGRSGLAQR